MISPVAHLNHPVPIGTQTGSQEKPDAISVRNPLYSNEDKAYRQGSVEHGHGLSEDRSWVTTARTQQVPVPALSGHRTDDLLECQVDYMSLVFKSKHLRSLIFGYTGPKTHHNMRRADTYLGFTKSPSPLQRWIPLSPKTLRSQESSRGKAPIQRLARTLMHLENLTPKDQRLIRSLLNETSDDSNPNHLMQTDTALYLQGRHKYPCYKTFCRHVQTYINYKLPTQKRKLLDRLTRTPITEVERAQITTEVIQLFNQHPLLTQAQDEHGNRPLHIVTEHGFRTQIATYLIEKAQVNPNDKNSDGKSPLELVIASRMFNVPFIQGEPDTPNLSLIEARSLIKYGADVKQLKKGKRNRLLLKAAKEGYDDLVDVVQEANTDMNRTDVRVSLWMRLIARLHK